MLVNCVQFCFTMSFSLQAPPIMLLVAVCIHLFTFFQFSGRFNNQWISSSVFGAFINKTVLLKSVVALRIALNLIQSRSQFIVGLLCVMEMTLLAFRFSDQHGNSLDRKQLDAPSNCEHIAAPWENNNPVTSWNFRSYCVLICMLAQENQRLISKQQDWCVEILHCLIV